MSHVCDAAAGRLVGHRSTFDGNVAVLRNCACGSTRVVQVHVDASVCRGCAALVTGRDGDCKIVVEHCDGGVYCVRCAATLLYVDDGIENARAKRRIMAARTRRPVVRDEDLLFESPGP